MNWEDVIKNKDFQDLGPGGQALVRQRWVEEVYVPELSKAGVSPEGIKGLSQEAMQEYDNGQGYVSSFLSSAGRGALGTVSSGIQGAGALMADPDIEAIGTTMQRGVEEALPINPSLPKTNFVGNVAGNLASFIGAGGIGGLAGRGLGLGARLGAETGSLGSGFFAGAGGGAQEADQYGITGTDRQMRALAGGVAEVVSEKLGGMGTEMQAISRLPGLSELRRTPGFIDLSKIPGLGGRTARVAGAVATETGEELASQTMGNISTNVLAPPGVEGPALTAGFKEAAAGGAIGGLGFGGISVLTGGTRRSDQAATDIITQAEANGDTAVAEITAELAAGVPAPAAVVMPAPNNRTTPVTAPEITAPAEGDASVLGDIDINAYAQANPVLAGVNDQPLTTPTIAPEQGVEVAPVEAEIAPSENLTAPVTPEATPEVVAEVAPAVVPEVAPAAIPEAVTEAPPTTVPEALQAPEIAAPMSQEEQSRLIDTQGRITPEAGQRIFETLKRLGITNADLVLNEGEVYPGGIKGVYRGQRVTRDGRDIVELNRNALTRDTPVHEAVGHGALATLQQSNPALYDQARAVLVDSPLWQAVKQRYAEEGHAHSTESELMEEVLATAYGNQSAEFWDRFSNNPGFVQKARQLIASIREWVAQYIGSKGIDPNMTLGDLAAKIDRQLLSGRLKEASPPPPIMEGTPIPPNVAAAESQVLESLPQAATLEQIVEAAPVSVQMAVAARAPNDTRQSWGNRVAGIAPALSRFLNTIWENITYLAATIVSLSTGLSMTGPDNAQITSAPNRAGQAVHRSNSVKGLSKANTAVVATTSPVQDLEGGRGVKLVSATLPALDQRSANEPSSRASEGQSLGEKTDQITQGEAPEHYVELPMDLQEDWLKQGDQTPAVRAAGEFLGEVEGENKVLARIFKHYGISESQDTYPWCATFTSFALSKGGAPTKIFNARGFLTVGQKVGAAQRGDVVVLWNDNPDTGGRNGWGGHAGLYLGETNSHVILISGNAGDMVTVSAFHKDRVLGVRRIESAPGGQSGPRYSLAPSPRIQPSGVSANQPGLVRSMFANITVEGESALPAMEQAEVLYNQNEARGASYQEHLATLDDIMARSGTAFFNMTPGSYFGMMLRDISATARNPALDEVKREQAREWMADLRQRWANVAAAGGQFIKGFDAGLKLANDPGMQVDWADSLVPFDGSQSRRADFDKEKMAVLAVGDEVTREQIDASPVAATAAGAAEGFADVAKGEDAADAGTITLEDTAQPDIDAMESQGNMAEQDWFVQGINSLNAEAQKLAGEWLTELKFIAALENQMAAGQFSLIPGAEMDAEVARRIAALRGSPDPKMAAQTALTEARKRAEEILRQMTRKKPKAAGAKPAAVADVQAMAVDRLYKTIEKLVAPAAKAKATSVAQQTADSIVTAILNRSGLTNSVSGSADKMVTALGLLLSNQDIAASVVQAVHTQLENNPDTQGALTRENLQGFMQLAVGKQFDEANGPSADAPAWGEKQIAAIMRAEMKSLGTTLTKSVRDAATARQTWASLEAQLRDPKRPFTKQLSPQALDRVVAAIGTEYNRTAKARAELLEKERAEQSVRDRMREEERQKTAYAKLQEEQARRNQQEAEKAVRDAMAAEKAAADRWATQQTRAENQIREEAQRAVRKAMAAEKVAAERWRKAQEAAAARVRKDAERAVQEQMAEQKRQIDKDLRFRMAVARKARADARRAKVAEMRTARAAGTEVPSPDRLDWQEIRDLNKKLATDPAKALTILTREFGFDLEATVSIMREQDRRAAISDMTTQLATALGMTKGQAAKFVEPVIAQAMKTVDAKRAAAVARKIEDTVKRLTGRALKKKGKTEAQKLVELAKLGALTAENVEKVMLAEMGATQFTQDFRDYLTSLIEKSNDPHLRQASRDSYTAAYLNSIRSARGLSAIGLWGEYTMANIFMAMSTMKVNAFWGGAKAIADNIAFLARFDPLNLTPQAQLPKGARQVLFRQMLRGYSSDLQYQMKYILKTGKSKLESDFTTQFSNSDMELLSQFPDTEIRYWLDGRTMSPGFQKSAHLLARWAKYTRRMMVGADIFNRTPAFEMIKANAVIKVMAEKGQAITQRAFDDAMYGGDFDAARAQAWRQTDEDIADGRASKEERGIVFGEHMDALMGKNLGFEDVDRAQVIEQAQEYAKRWTVANVTEGLLGVVSNTAVAAVRDVPGLKFLLPAIRMPIGAFSQGLDWTPYGFLRAQAIGWNKGRSSSVTNAIFNRQFEKKGFNLPAGGVPSEQVIDLRNKAAMGTALMLGFVLLAAQSYDDDEDKAFFFITGRGPRNPQDNKLWREKGNRPYMVRIGGIGANFQESPMFPGLSAIGAWSDAHRYGAPEDTESDRLTYAMMRTLSGFGDAAVLKSFQDALGIATGGNLGEEGAADKIRQTFGRIAGLSIAPRLGNEIEQILYGAKDMKQGGWAGYMFANVPFVSSILNKPATNFFGEDLHEVRGPLGEALPMLAHRISPILTDDPQARFVAKMGATKLSTTRRFQDGTEVMEDYDTVRAWAKASGQQIRKALTPERMAYFERLREKDRETAEKEFDKFIRDIRLSELKKIPKVIF